VDEQTGTAWLSVISVGDTVLHIGHCARKLGKVELLTEEVIFMNEFVEKKSHLNLLSEKKNLDSRQRGSRGLLTVIQPVP